MDRRDASTAERVRVVGQLLGHAGEYGVVTALSRAVGVTRPTLYAWRAKGERAVATPELTRRVLTTLVAGHASDRGLQDCLAAEGRSVSLGTVAGVVQEAERRALLVMARPAAPWPGRADRPLSFGARAAPPDGDSRSPPLLTGVLNAVGNDGPRLRLCAG